MSTGTQTWSPRPSYFELTGDDLIDAMTTGYKWSYQSDYHVLYFSVSSGFNGEYWTNPAAVRDGVAAILNSFGEFANLRFNFNNFYPNPSAAAELSDINISLDGAGLAFNSSSVWARAFFPAPTYENSPYSGAAGDVFVNLNSQAVSLPSYGPGSQGWFLFMHELGHSLGLKHPHDDGGTGRPTFSAVGEAALDKDWFTIMSYNDDAQWNLFNWDPATPMAGDVIALQYLYGKNMNTKSGDTTIAIAENGTYRSIWDASGVDTIDLSTAHSGWVVLMPNSAISSLVDSKVGAAGLLSEFDSDTPTEVVWLIGDYENLTGSRYGDLLTGNLFNNRIKGSGGNDSVDGGDGCDLCVFTGARSQYQLNVQAGTVADTQANRDGTDTLSNVERLKFSDINLAFDTDKGQTAGSAYRIYKAAFDRAPDAGGLGFWIDAMDDGALLLSVATGFISSPEFQKLYGANVSDRDYVTKLYNNVLDRNPDQGGYDFWLGALANGATREDILVNFSESKENIANVANLIANGIQYQEWVG
jgi:hypothetical protein